MKKDSRLAWGVTLLLFGVMFLLRQLNILPPDVSNILFDIRNYPIYAGIIFLICHSNRSVGLVLLALGLFLRYQDVIRLTSKLSSYVWPTLLIVVGVILVFGVKRGKK